MGALIHMNGRVYDYNLGRFLSVDPFIQDPGNSQSMNPYSYIMNNPLRGIDPSGYLSESSGGCDLICATDGELTSARLFDSYIASDNGKEVIQSAKSAVAKKLVYPLRILMLN
ncbi:MAG: RHS repeat-associated protein [Enterobacterales bacterium]|jgi:RHS repeat-associated protein